MISCRSKKKTSRRDIIKAILFIIAASSVLANYYFFAEERTTFTTKLISEKDALIIPESSKNQTDVLSVEQKIDENRNENNALIIPDRKNETDILVLVMGELGALEKWYNILKSIDATFSFIYASFDAQISQEQNAIYMENATFPFQVIFIPGTTWTQGRNILAEEAIRLEKKRGKEFSHWLFMDDDVVPLCYEECKTFYGDGSCWQNVFNFISSSKVPDNASTIYPQMDTTKDRYDGMKALSTPDALFAAFKREYVPYMLPYPNLREGYSQWMSQAALFCVMRTCLKSSVVNIPYIHLHNSLSRPYERGLILDQMKQIVKDNYVTDEFGFETCLSYTIHDIQQNLDSTEWVPVEESDKFSTLIPSPELTKCAPMKKRFETWKESVLSVEQKIDENRNENNALIIPESNRNN